MTSPGSTTLRSGIVGTGKSAPTSHLSSHARLLRAASSIPPEIGRTRYGRPDAIIVPATRPASGLINLIELAAALRIPIVVLCSRQAKVDQVAERIGRVIGARGIVVQIDSGYRIPGLTLETSSPTFLSASAGRSSDLSVKRNVGLLLARLNAWRKIAFIDDDITVAAADIARLGHQLDHHQVAGMACREYPDNSVFCHARRLAKMPQDVFVTGAVLGVNCSDLPLPFFADVYNEDWFFFAEAAAHRSLTQVGEAGQAVYDPFARSARASEEEFGDLLAEGLYALIEKLHAPVDLRHPGGFFPSVAAMATEKYWSTYIDARRVDLVEVWSSLDDLTGRDDCSDDVFAALRSLDATSTRSIRSRHSSAWHSSTHYNATSSAGTRSMSVPTPFGASATPSNTWRSRRGRQFDDTRSGRRRVFSSLPSAGSPARRAFVHRRTR